MAMNRHERRRKDKLDPKVMKIIVGDVEMTFTPATVQKVMDEWQADNPGADLNQMPPKEFADRCMAKLVGGARRLPTGTA
jgi:hypothetical protein